MKAEPQPEHEWLQKLVGEWIGEIDPAVQPGQPPHPSWSESVRSLHGLWVVAEGRGEMPGGGPMATMMTLGYDPQKKRYVGTWCGSIMTHLWIYEGWLDETGKVLTLDTEGPNFGAEGGMALYQDAIEFMSDDHRVLTSRMLDGGTWKEVMKAHYRRKT
jgi:Protein of unknown function (DUF1579)